MKSKPTTDSTPSTPGIGADDVLDLLDDLLGAVDRGALRQPHGGEERALVLFGQEALRRHGEQAAPRPPGRRRRRRRRRAATRTSRLTIDAIAVAHACRCRRAHSASAPARWPRFDQHRAERRAQGQRVERRDQHRDRNGDGELPEQLAADAGDEGDRHEHREQHQRDRDDRAGDLAPSPSWSPRGSKAPAPPRPRARRSRSRRWRRRPRCRWRAPAPAARRCWRCSRSPASPRRCR